eukprot:355775-Chlamydomonas_euryale.AAC.2
MCSGACHTLRRGGGGSAAGGRGPAWPGQEGPLHGTCRHFARYLQTHCMVPADTLHGTCRHKKDHCTVPADTFLRASGSLSPTRCVRLRLWREAAERCSCCEERGTPPGMHGVYGRGLEGYPVCARQGTLRMHGDSKDARRVQQGTLGIACVYGRRHAHFSGRRPAARKQRSTRAEEVRLKARACTCWGSCPRPLTLAVDHPLVVRLNFPASWGVSFPCCGRQNLSLLLIACCRGLGKVPPRPQNPDGRVQGFGLSVWSPGFWFKHVKNGGSI